MKRTKLYVLLGGLAFALLTLSGAAADKVINSAWVPVPVKIDGLDQDWQDVARLIDKTSKAEYAFKNDGQNLYVLFVFNDSRAKSTIDLVGMTVYYSVDGKKKKDNGLHFNRKEVTADELIASMEAKGETLTEAQKAEMRKRPGYVLFDAELLGEKAGEGAAAVEVEPPTFRAQQAPPPKMDPQQAQTQGRGGMARPAGRKSVYEFRIPLAHSPKAGGIGTDPGKQLKIFFEWGGITKEIAAKMAADAGDAASRASVRVTSLERSLAGGDESGSEGGGGGSLRRNPNAIKHSFWVDLKLAIQQ